MDDTILIILICIISISVFISIGLIIYFIKSSNDATYGSYIDIYNKTQNINSLPVEFTAKSIKALFPGCIPKPNFNPIDQAPIICSKGMFDISGKQNDTDGFITIGGIAGSFLAKSSGSTYTVKLTAASDKEYKDAQKLIN